MARRITSVTYGPRIFSRSGGRSWSTHYYVDGCEYSAGTYKSQLLAAKALSKCGVALRLLCAMFQLA